MSDSHQSALIGSLQKFSVEDGPGIRTTIFMKGCPLKCKWCHNPELIDPKQQLIMSPNNCIGCGHCVEVCPNDAISIQTADDGKVNIIIDREKCHICLKCTEVCYAKALRPVAKSMTIDEIIDIVHQDKGFYDNTDGGITISGGEILMQAEFVSELIHAAFEGGIDVCLDTSGYGDSKALMDFALSKNVSYILYDMKSIDDNVHKKYTGVSNQLILRNLRMLASDERTKNKLIMRMPLIKGLNDSVDIIKLTGNLYEKLGIKRVNLLPYHTLGISKERNIGSVQEEFETPTDERITEIEDYFRDEIGMDVEILGKS